MADAPRTADVPQQIDLDLGMAVERLDGWVDGAIRLLPNAVVGVVVVLLFWLLARVAQKIVQRGAARTARENLGDVLGAFVKWAVVLLGVLLAATIVIPSLKPGDLIGGLGVGSVAIGFAFKDILQNWLAGLLILIRQPFQIHDQIEVNGFEGTVERIETRATIIATYDGQRVVVPNSDIYTNAVVVKTAHDRRRSQYDVGIGYGDDLQRAADVMRAAVASVPEVLREPAPEALPWDLAASWVAIRLRWWTESRRADVVLVHAKVLTAVKLALDEAGIDMPFETQVHLFHDQTDADDGRRGVQREGWPRRKDRESPPPRWEMQPPRPARGSEGGEGARAPN